MKYAITEQDAATFGVFYCIIALVSERVCVCRNHEILYIILHIHNDIDPFSWQTRHIDRKKPCESGKRKSVEAYKTLHKIRDLRISIRYLVLNVNFINH